MSELFDIRKFDEYKEDNRREVKKAQGGLPNSLWETYSAFANCRGGVIVLGVVENEDGSWRTTGLKDSRKLLKDFWDTINNTKKVNLNILTERNVEVYEVSGDVIIVIEVPSADRKVRPVFLNNDIMQGTYRRTYEGDYKCTPAEVKGMLRDAPEDTPDMKVLVDMPMSVFNSDSVRQYRNMHKNHIENHVWENLPNDEYLEKIGAAKISKDDGQLHPTAAGLLMFGEEYKILYEFPEYFLDFREEMNVGIRWTDRIQSMSGDWSGNLFDFYFRVYPKLVKDFKIPFKMEGIFRIDDTPVHKAIREALANCLVNTDFFFPRGVVIKKTEQSIVFENPGSVRTGKEQMLRGGISDPRNKALMKMFNLIGIGERAGSGVPNIYDVWKNEGFGQPVVEEEYGPDRTRLVLPVTDMSLGLDETQTKPKLNPNSHLDELDRRIIETIMNDPYLSQSQIAESISEKTNSVKTRITKMKKYGIISREGTSHTGIWVVNDDII